MASAKSCRHVLVETDDEFDSTLREHAVEIDLANEADERAYEQLDQHVADHLDAVLRDVVGADNCEVLYHQNYDWWPTRTRFLELDAACLSWNLVTQLQSTLTGVAEDWRINIHVYRPLDGTPSEHVGGLNVYRDWLLIQKPVFNVLNSAVA